MCYYIFSIYDLAYVFCRVSCNHTRHHSKSDVCQGPRILCAQLDEGCMTTLLGSADKLAAISWKKTCRC